MKSFTKRNILKGLFFKFIIICLSILLLGCGQKDPRYQTLTIAGSTSVQPFAEKLAEVYMQHHPGLLINVQGGGSSAGIMAVQQRAADIGASSRELNESEKNLHELVIAWDGIAIIVNPACKLDDLSLIDLHQIFEGKLTNWKALGLAPHGIHVITREEGSGTRTAFEELVMKKTEITPQALVQDSNGAVREIVANDPYAIGFISCGLVSQQVKALAIDGVSPTGANIKKNTYKLTRRFLFVTLNKPEGQVKDFDDFVLSQIGQMLLEKEGLIGVN
jgi:phosphate transport system substrate-binding protein